MSYSWGQKLTHSIHPITRVDSRRSVRPTYPNDDTHYPSVFVNNVWRHLIPTRSKCELSLMRINALSLSELQKDQDICLFPITRNVSSNICYSFMITAKYLCSICSLNSNHEPLSMLTRIFAKSSKEIEGFKSLRLKRDYKKGYCGVFCDELLEEYPFSLLSIFTTNSDFEWKFCVWCTLFSTNLFGHICTPL